MHGTGADRRGRPRRAAVDLPRPEPGSGDGQLYESALFLEDYRAFVHHELPEPRTVPAPDSFETHRVEHLSFRYPGAEDDALRDVSIELRAGEVIALVGENGSGKTTLAKLLASLYRPTSGRILWDDVDVTECDPDGLRASIALIFQDFVRYQLAANENIAMGRHERFGDVDGVRRAAKGAGADDFIASLPQAYETVLGKEFPGGVDLSIGQWQRVALARAFFRDAPFIILDEPTAALDPRAEGALFESMRSLCVGRTVLLISHRFSSVRTADRIYVLDHGRVVESGTHEYLVAGRAVRRVVCAAGERVHVAGFSGFVGLVVHRVEESEHAVRPFVRAREAQSARPYSQSSIGSANAAEPKMLPPCRTSPESPSIRS